MGHFIIYIKVPVYAYVTLNFNWRHFCLNGNLAVLVIGQLEVGALISYEKQDVGLRGKSVFLKHL